MLKIILPILLIIAAVASSQVSAIDEKLFHKIMGDMERTAAICGVFAENIKTYCENLPSTTETRTGYSCEEIVKEMNGICNSILTSREDVKNLVTK